jgi:hypothetical protein
MIVCDRKRGPRTISGTLKVAVLYAILIDGW